MGRWADNGYVCIVTVIIPRVKAFEIFLDIEEMFNCGFYFGHIQFNRTPSQLLIGKKGFSSIL